MQKIIRDGCWLSALTGEGLDLLNQAIVERLADTMIICNVILDHHEGKLLSKLYKMGVVKKETTDKEGHICLCLEIQRENYQRIFRNKKTQKAYLDNLDET